MSRNSSEGGTNRHPGLEMRQRNLAGSFRVVQAYILLDN